MAESDPDPLFVLDEVIVEVPGRRILDAVDVTIPVGRLTVLGGPSGAGKTRLLRLLNRLDVPGAGRILLRGVDVSDIDARALRRDVAMVFQSPPLFPGSVADNLRVADPALSDRRMAAVLEGVELTPSFAARDAKTLSGGEAQRVCFARALSTGPSVVLGDEPTSALDPAPKRALEQLARKLVDGGLSVVWVTHDAGQIHRIADHLVVLAAGRVIAAGAPTDLVDHDHEVVRSALGADE